MAKPLSPGKAAFNGTLAAMLVAKGFTGPREALESREGFFHGYADTIEEQHLCAGLGSSFKVMEIAFKRHAACRYAHGPIDAAQSLYHEGVRLDDVVDVRVHMCELAIRQSGRAVVPNLNAAMGSTPFGVALALAVGKNGLGEYSEGFRDSRVHQVAGGIELVAEPAYGLMGRQAVVEVSLRDGAQKRFEVAGPKGEPDYPLTDEELTAKFLGLAEMAIGQSRARELNDLVMNLEQVDDVHAVTQLLVK